MADAASIVVENVSKHYRIWDHPAARLKRPLLELLARGFPAGSNVRAALERKAASYCRDFPALHELSFEVRRGERWGVIGRNGAGKSTLLQIVAGTLQPTTGTVRTRGRVCALLELGSGFNPEFTGRENVQLAAGIVGIEPQALAEKMPQILAFADIGEFVDQPIKTYSSGMHMRLAFAVHTAIDPDILIIDEALAVGDILFQSKCLRRMREMCDRGATVILVTHGMGTFQDFCNRGLLLHRGRLRALGAPKELADLYWRILREEEEQNDRRTAPCAVSPAPSAPPADSTQPPRRRHAATGADEQRSGNGAALIVDFRLLDESGAETTQLRTGEFFTAEMVIEARQAIPGPAVGIMFVNVNGLNLMGMHTFYERRLSIGALAAGETLVVRCRQRMLLNPDRYLLNLAVTDRRDEEDFTTLDHRIAFGSVVVHGKLRAYGTVHTEPVFEFERIAPAPLPAETA